MSELCGHPRARDGRPCEHVVAERGDYCWQHESRRAGPLVPTQARLPLAPRRTAAVFVGVVILLLLERDDFAPMELLSRSGERWRADPRHDWPWKGWRAVQVTQEELEQRRLGMWPRDLFEVLNLSEAA